MNKSNQEQLFQTKINYFELSPALLLPIIAIALLFTSRYFFSPILFYYAYRFIVNTPVRFTFDTSSFSVHYLFKKVDVSFDQIKQVNFRKNTNQTFSIEIDLFNYKFYCIKHQHPYLKAGIFHLLNENNISLSQI